MNRFRIVSVAAGLLAIAAIRALGLLQRTTAEAQGAPPTIGMVIYGNAPSGAVAGQNIVALVVRNGVTTACGDGEVVDEGGLKYVVRVRPSSARTGCGEAGATVRFFFSAANGNPGRFSSNSIPWVIGPKEENGITLGAALPVRGRVASAARDGTN